MEDSTPRRLTAIFAGDRGEAVAALRALRAYRRLKAILLVDGR
jgi:hypothetical protein